MFKSYAEKRRRKFYVHVRPEIKERVESGEPVTYEEYQKMRYNSYELKLVHDVLDDDALIRVTERYLAEEGCSCIYKYDIPHSYKDAVLQQHIHELIKRLKSKLAEGNKMSFKVIVKPGNKRLKQLIKEFGEIWKSEIYHPYVPCFNGPGYYVESLDGEHRRWVEEEHVVLIEDEQALAS